MTIRPPFNYCEKPCSWKTHSRTTSRRPGSCLCVSLSVECCCEVETTRKPSRCFVLICRETSETAVRFLVWSNHSKHKRKYTLRPWSNRSLTVRGKVRIQSSRLQTCS